MVILGGSSITLEELERVARGNESVELSDAARFSIRESRRRLEKAASGSQPVYGVNTGFGDFSEIKISKDKAKGPAEEPYCIAFVRYRESYVEGCCKGHDDT